MIKRILVALSGTPFTAAAVRHALELAATHGAEVTGVTDVDLPRLANVGPVPLGAGAAAHELVEHRLQVTERHIAEAVEMFDTSCHEAGSPGRVVRETGDPFDRLVALWRYHDLTLLGLRGLFDYGVVHNPDDLVVELIARGVRPIVAVARSYRPVKRVLAAYNGSMESAKALKQFVQMRLWPDVALTVAAFGDLPEAGRLLADAVDYCRAHGYDATGRRVDAEPRAGLLEHAGESGADLVVMGSTSRARILKRLLGDTALHTIRHAEIPLFLSQ